MKKYIFIICLLIFSRAYSQTRIELKFAKPESWQALLKMAKSEKKIIFIDAYATWCVPCRKMDSEVFTDSNVAAFFNKNFISVKIQIDKSKDDSDYSKSWYDEAAIFQNKFAISALPTFLFLDNQCQQVVRHEGFINARQLLELGITAQDTSSNYRALIDKFKRRQFKNLDLLSLSLKAIEYKEDSIAFDIARIFKKRYLSKIGLSNGVNPELLNYLIHFEPLIHTKDKIIDLLYQYPDRCDSLFKNKGISQTITDFIVTKDFVNPYIYNADKTVKVNPDWLSIEKTIAKRFGQKTKSRVILKAKIGWFEMKKDWSNFVESTIQLQDINGLDTTGIGKALINNMVFDVIFKHGVDPAVLQRGIEYMDVVMQGEDDWSYLDTYANVLYKLGRKDEALVYERKAINAARKKQKPEMVLYFEEIKKKMELNLPTW